jgi:YVTN family beta-propeller protein
MNFGFTVYGDPYVTTDQNGNALISGGRVPASWDIYWLMPWWCGATDYLGQKFFDGANWNEYEFTAYPVANYYQYPSNGTVPLNCFQYGPLPTASTRFAILGSLPNTLTLTSEAPLTTQYGMPLLYVYGGTGTVIATETATSVSSDGTQATFPFPSTLAENGYSLALVNQIGSAPGYSPAGTNLLSIAQSTTIPGNPFGVAAQVITQTRSSATNPDPYGDGTCAGQWTYSSSTNTYAVPVVTQYSLNSVNNGGATIPAGPNPTAIALYDSQDNEEDWNNGPCNSYERDTTQMTRAIVANSGGNTVSVLDIVNNVVLSTITVGNQPVALAVSADGSAAYVANYTDGTVTQVNLNSGTVTATVAVGAQPTSVALTAAGTLWVGGVGFLTQLNANPMSVVATEAVTGKSIVALGFSNSVNQLVATTVDPNGNVYAEEISPSTVRTGSPYSPLASNMVSSLGTYGTVRAYTATLAGGRRGTGGLLNMNQVGAPPLVVQDGWAVVTATPTGFTITDITGQVVLVSETTPSPVTAIALDSNLNAAYLLMPDSNTLLTVPLPGTNQAN